MNATAVPTLDLRRYAAGGTTRSRFLDELRDAVGSIGAFSLVGHGIDPSEADRVLALSRRLFALPPDALREIEMLRSPHFRGYTSTGMERTQNRIDWREQLDVARESLPRPHRPGDKPYWGLLGPNQWPAALPELRPAIENWIARCSDVAHRLLQAICTSLGLAPDHFDDAFAGEPHAHLKIVRYPGLTGDRDDQGVGAHKDYGFVTLVLQDDVGGLQFAGTDGSFVDVAPQRGAFAVNLGEMLEVATAGGVRATIHRVVSPPAGIELISLPFFYNPRLDYVTGGAQAQSSTGLDGSNHLIAEYGYNALKGWLRAHPHVAARHYPELAGRDVAQLIA